MDKKNRIPEFEYRFKELQKKMGCERNDAEFARRIGITRQTVSKYRNGDRVPDAFILKKIASAGNVSVDWLMGEERKMDNCYICGKEIERGCQYIISRRDIKDGDKSWYAQDNGRISLCSECDYGLRMYVRLIRESKSENI